MDKTICTDGNKVIVGISIKNGDIFTEKFTEIIDEVFAHIIIKGCDEGMSIEEMHEQFINKIKDIASSAAETLCDSRGGYLTSPEHSEEFSRKVLKVKDEITNIENGSNSCNE